MTTDGIETCEALLERLLATRREIYQVLREHSTNNLTATTLSPRLLDLAIRLDTWIVEITDQFARLDSQEMLIQQLTAERHVANVHFAALCDPAAMHPTMNARTAPSQILEPDPDDERSREAAQRVMAAYRRAMESGQAPGRSIW